MVQDNVSTHQIKRTTVYSSVRERGTEFSPPSNIRTVRARRVADNQALTAGGNGDAVERGDRTVDHRKGVGDRWGVLLRQLVGNTAVVTSCKRTASERGRRSENSPVGFGQVAGVSALKGWLAVDDGTEEAVVAGVLLSNP